MSDLNPNPKYRRPSDDDYDYEFDDDDFEDDDASDDDADGIPLQQIAVTIEKALEILECGDMQTEYGILRFSSNYAFLVAVSQDDMTMNAVYKPQKGERPLWDFPDGTLCYRECAAFLTSQELGWQIVPPTVLREGPRGIGSVQMFIEHDPTVNYYTHNEAPGTLLPQLQRFAAFDAVINNADRKGGHCLLDPNRHLWGIDHGIAFHSAHKLRTVIWEFAGDSIPDPLLDDMDRLCVALDNNANPYRQRLTSLLSAVEIRALQNRLKSLMRTKKFPQPGAGPNYPWPPI